MACKEDDYTYTNVLRFVFEKKKRLNGYSMIDFINDFAYRIFVGTWNVNGQPPNKISLEDWLCKDEVPPDLYAIGFQELDLSKEAFLFNDTPREEEWRQVVAKYLHPKGSYEIVALVRLVGMMLIVFTQTTHLPYIKNVCVDTVGTGIMGKMVI